MNAPAQLAHLVPDIQQRPVPAELLAALQSRFSSQCSTAMAVREQHGRDESVYDVPPRKVRLRPPARAAYSSTCTR